MKEKEQLIKEILCKEILCIVEDTCKMLPTNVLHYILPKMKNIKHAVYKQSLKDDEIITDKLSKLEAMQNKRLKEIEERGDDE